MRKSLPYSKEPTTRQDHYGLSDWVGLPNQHAGPVERPPQGPVDSPPPGPVDNPPPGPVDRPPPGPVESPPPGPVDNPPPGPVDMPPPGPVESPPPGPVDRPPPGPVDNPPPGPVDNPPPGPVGWLYHLCACALEAPTARSAAAIIEHIRKQRMLAPRVELTYALAKADCPSPGLGCIGSRASHRHRTPTPRLRRPSAADARYLPVAASSGALRTGATLGALSASLGPTRFRRPQGELGRELIHWCC